MNTHFQSEPHGSARETTLAVGTCFCGAVEVTATGTPVEMGYCHCRSCRSYSGAPLTAYTLWRDAQVVISRGADRLGAFQKGPMSRRRSCLACGGHVLTEHPGFGFTDVHASVFPGLKFLPSVHLNYAETVLPVRDGLPKLRDFPVHAGGSGELLPE